MPPLGGPRLNIAIPFGMEKLEWCDYSTIKKFEDMFSHCDRIPACDRRTDVLINSNMRVSEIKKKCRAECQVLVTHTVAIQYRCRAKCKVQ